LIVVGSERVKFVEIVFVVSSLYDSVLTKSNKKKAATTNERKLNEWM
jgi:hypothetical protein